MKRRGLDTANAAAWMLTGMCVAFGLYYLATPTITPWHQQFIEVPFAQLPARLRALLSGLVDLVGVLFLALGLAYRLYWQTRPRKGRLDWTLVAVFSPPLLFLQIATLRVGGSAPAWAPALCWVALGVSARRRA